MTIHALGPFRLDTRMDLLFRGSEPAALGRRAIALLRELVERPGALVSKDALIEAAWPGQAVEESNLTVQIAALRRVLGDAPGGARWIETMPCRGYRFIGPVVTEVEKGVMAPPQLDPARDAAPTPHADPERRQITAMSCELIGMSGRAHGFALEDLREVVGAFSAASRRSSIATTGSSSAVSGIPNSSFSAIPRRTNMTPSRRSARGSNCVRRSGP